MAGAPGIEPGNAGIKIRCLTAWRRPIIDLLHYATFEHKSLMPLLCVIRGGVIQQTQKGVNKKIHSAPFYIY